MRRIFGSACAVLLAATLLQCQTSLSASNSAPQSPSSRKTSSKARKSRKTNWRRRGQQKIDRKRAEEIQEALVREHYLDRKPSGVWDDATQKAMQKYQADNGWQSKTTPDSRALIKLGLGPDHDHLLNPESAMTGVPQSSHNLPVTPSEPEKSPR